MKLILKKSMLHFFPTRLFYYFSLFLFYFIQTLSRLTARLNRFNTIGIPFADHYFDWLRGPNYWHWQVRGVMGASLIKKGDRVLDLAAGDCFFSGVYFNQFAKEIHAIDRNEISLKVAKRRYKKIANLKIYNLDLLKDPFPSVKYDVIFMFMAIEHFDLISIDKLLLKIVNSLSGSTSGTFFGCTPIFKHSQLQQHFEHEHEFTSIDELEAVLKKHFKEVSFFTVETVLGGREDVYFTCKV